MKKTILSAFCLKTCLKTYLIASLAIFLNASAYAESPPVVPPPAPDAKDRNNFVVTLLNKKANPFCRGSIIAPSWILTAKHCITTGLTSVTDKKRGKKVLVAKKIKYWGSDSALIKLYKPFYGRKNSASKPVALVANPLKKKHGVVTYKKVSHSLSRGRPLVYNDLKLRANNKRSLKSLTPKGKAGSSGSPWAVYNPKIGVVQVAITHGGGKGPQVGSLKQWINKHITEHTPNEKVTWIDVDKLIPTK